METPAYFDPESPADYAKGQQTSAFSLVEVALALGIMSFALVAVFSLMPLGMTMFRKALDLSIGSQIAQRVVGDAQQSDFDTLISNNGVAAAAGVAFDKPKRYFDEEGDEVAGYQAGVIYMVNTRVVPATYMPSTAPSGLQNLDIATVTVQVANNPGNLPLVADNTTQLWSATGPVKITEFSTYVARNSPPTAP